MDSSQLSIDQFSGAIIATCSMMEVESPRIIRTGATGVTVLAGVRIGRGTIVGAGSVVTTDLPPGVIAAGVPAKVVRNINAGERGQ